ncbi:extracellular solute-binding protein, partial [bacterium]|nr:extracellular solute-binding protein [bacterium]
MRRLMGWPNRILPFLLLALMPHASHAGFIEDKDGRTIIHVTVFNLPDPVNTDAFNRAEVAAVRTFEERFPDTIASKYSDEYKAHPEIFGEHDWDNVEISLEKFSGIRVEGVEVDLLAIAGGLAPDVLYINFRKSDNYIRNNFLYPLDKPEDNYLTGMTEEEVAFRIHPRIWPVIDRKGPRGEKHVWALPYGGAIGKVLLYRKDLFDAKGLTYPTADWTWDDLLGAARTLTDPRRGVSGMLFVRGKDESYHWVTFLWSAGGEVMTYDEETDQWRCVFDSPEAAVALDFYIQISAEKWTDEEGRIRRGYSSKDAPDSYQKWERGEIAMMLGYMDEKVFSRINPEVTGIAPVPLGPTGMRGSELNSRMMGLFSDIEQPAVRDAAWEYMRFYESEPAVRIKTRVMVEGGLGRFVNPRYLRLFGYPEIERLSPKGWADIFETAIANSRPEPYGKNSNIAYDMMTFPIQKAEQMAINGELPEDRQERLDVLQQLLVDGCRRANAEMIGIVPPREQLKRRITAILVLIAIAITFGLVFKKVSKDFAPPSEGLAKKTWAFRRYAWAYVLLLPAALTILLWQYAPLVQGSVMAFFDYRILGDSTWVGVDNFGDLLYDGYWWRSVWNSMRYSFLILALTFLPPIILAILLQEVPRGRLLFRTIYYLPAVITGLVTVLMWKQFYE